MPRGIENILIHLVKAFIFHIRGQINVKTLLLCPTFSKKIPIFPFSLIQKLFFGLLQSTFTIPVIPEETASMLMEFYPLKGFTHNQFYKRA